ncbi:MATE family efflux transporter [Methanimicrococcus blatticola]|uniref:Putative MATE family efflux protein n=1 Tax=Methanimicrococcus blatticola TaxID=91560 RepID=A0A484F348_9EURY|nr:MATE family efflux transporter [Methanimicrococcus blatticola]MBZ3936350.1 MATE family efflux transporter [Methanimicrococcus blatticola]MCC2509512.1 MATE family efflux transporter [Methanimicrococcus blatticola]TDQ67565.1 putative MATE family efflux protein [Methanimicrococcus blatticola]
MVTQNIHSQTGEAVDSDDTDKSTFSSAGSTEPQSSPTEPLTDSAVLNTSESGSQTITDGGGTAADTDGSDGENPGGMTKGVADLLGNPKKAMIKVSIPVMIALFFESIYNLVDTFWVAGLGAEALAAVGLAFPFFIALMAIATGIGVGAGSAVSRAIGSKDKKSADKFATHAIIFAVIMSFISWLAVPLMEPIFMLMGADASLAAVTAGYMNPFIFCSFSIFLLNVGNSLLNSEGNSRKTMFATIVGAVLNMILDPIFIFDWGLGLGVNGAAYASVLSFSVSTAMIMYWLLIQKKTYVTIRFKGFRFEWPIIRDIIIVGIPAMVSQLTMSISTVLLNAIVLNVGGTDGAAIYSTGWRIISIGIMPMMGLATGVTTMSGVSFGGRDIKKLKSIYYFGIQIGLVLEVLIAAGVFIFADPIAGIFATGESAYLQADIAEFLQIMCLIFLFLPANILTSSMLQGLKMGPSALVLTLIRAFVFEVPIAYLLGVYMGMGLPGVFIGALAGDFIVMVISFIFGNYVIHNLMKLYRKPVIDTHDSTKM